MYNFEQFYILGETIIDDMHERFKNSSSHKDLELTQLSGTDLGARRDRDFVTGMVDKDIKAYPYADPKIEKPSASLQKLSLGMTQDRKHNKERSRERIDELIDAKEFKKKRLKKYGIGAGVALGTGAAGYGVYRYLKKRRQDKKDKEQE